MDRISPHLSPLLHWHLFRASAGWRPLPGRFWRRSRVPSRWHIHDIPFNAILPGVPRPRYLHWHWQWLAILPHRGSRCYVFLKVHRSTFHDMVLNSDLA